MHSPEQHSLHFSPDSFHVFSLSSYKTAPGRVRPRVSGSQRSTFECAAAPFAHIQGFKANGEHCYDCMHLFLLLHSSRSIRERPLHTHPAVATSHGRTEGDTVGRAQLCLRG